MPRDREKALARSRRYREKRKVEKYGPEAAGVDMRGRAGTQPRGPAHPRWNDARMVNSDGYVKVRVGQEHPLADPNGYAYEHLVVWAAAGRPLPQDHELLHHRNEVKSDNRLSNLQLMTRAEHNALHIAARRRDPVTGRLLDGVTHDGFPEAGRVGAEGSRRG
ncbi:HNH endonuclease [Methylobacterium aquaticum]|uniref:HNH endonuclease n=1 Tax=Methylobacterium aquaticum TaxID=270351 RepID=UPI00069EB1AF|nr:HNH endonuclease [Methylobacterium aquaticum]